MPRFRNSGNVALTAISLRRRSGASGLTRIWGNLAAIWSMASWEIFSATPSGNGLSPMLSAVPNLSISHDETFSNW